MQFCSHRHECFISFDCNLPLMNENKNIFSKLKYIYVCVGGGCACVYKGLETKVEL